MERKAMEEIKRLREMMKSYTAADEDFITDQQEGKEQPPINKYFEGEKRISLTKDFSTVVKCNDFLSLLESRESRRQYKEEQGLTFEELSFLLWSTQGVKKVTSDQKATLRIVPSAGARHPYETYLFVNHVKGLEKGLYHYLPIEHELEQLTKLCAVKDNQERLNEAFLGQTFATEAPVMFLWTILPYRAEYRYASKAHRCALMDAGHIGQNLYLAAEAMECATCIVGAFDQELADGLLGLDTNPSESKENEFVVFAAGVGPRA